MTDSIDRGLASLLIGESPAMRRVRALIRKVARSPIPVLIQGPTGSGKELVARALHLASGRRGEFVAFNVCAIAESMFEDVLFGHRRGAFTGAVTDAPGYLLEGHEGSVFLDEISGLTMASQAKLLRAVETKEYRPLGAKTDQRSDFRIVSATNEHLDELVEQGRFRRDLLFRIRGVVIEVPPLNHRSEDVPALVRHFASLSGSGDSEHDKVSDDAIDFLCARQWEGNVRELRTLVECAATLSERGLIGRREVLQAASMVGRSELSVQHRYKSPFVERRLMEVLESTEWDVAATATILGVHRATVYRRLERAHADSLRRDPHRLEPPALGASDEPRSSMSAE